MLSYNETKELVEMVLNGQTHRIRLQLHEKLILIGSKEGEFYESIAKHGPFMKLTSDQWLNLLTKLYLRSKEKNFLQQQDKRKGNRPPWDCARIYVS